MQKFFASVDKEFFLFAENMPVETSWPAPLWSAVPASTFDSPCDVRLAPSSFQGSQLPLGYSRYKSSTLKIR